MKCFWSPNLWFTNPLQKDQSEGGEIKSLWKRESLSDGVFDGVENWDEMWWTVILNVNINKTQSLMLFSEPETIY